MKHVYDIIKITLMLVFCASAFVAPIILLKQPQQPAAARPNCK